MKLLLDESIDVRLRHDLIGHDVFTVDYLGWKGTKNGHLLSRAASEGFEAFITTDRAIPAQQNLAAMYMITVVLHSGTNSLDELRPLIPEVLRQLQSAKPGSVIAIDR
jgi:hypothetical protein